MTGRGYTLVELVIVMAVMGIVAAVGVTAVLETADAWSIASRLQDFSVQSSIVTMNRMSREIRRIKNDASINSADATQISFVDLDNNTMSYSRSANTLLRNSDGLADNVSSLAFTYYDDEGNTITTPVISPSNTDIRRISVDFSIFAGTNTLNFRFQVRPQNLRRLNEKFK